MRQSPLAAAAPAAAVYIVLDDFGDLGRACRETGEAETDAASVIANLLCGEYSRPLRVVAFSTCDLYSGLRRETRRSRLRRATNSLWELETA
jgi:hypothetical protein